MALLVEPAVPWTLIYVAADLVMCRGDAKRDAYDVFHSQLPFKQSDQACNAINSLILR